MNCIRFTWIEITPKTLYYIVWMISTTLDRTLKWLKNWTMATVVLSISGHLKFLYYSIWLFQEPKSYVTVCSWFFQPKVVRGLFHFYIGGLYKKDQNQLKKPSIIRLPKQWSSKNGFSVLKLVHRWHFSAKFIEVHKFWKPNDRWFFQLILIFFMFTCNVKVKKSMDFLILVEKPGAHSGI